VTLLAFAAAWRPPLLIDIACPHGAQQQTRRARGDCGPMMAQTDARPCYASSVNEQVHAELYGRSFYGSGSVLL